MNMPITDDEFFKITMSSTPAVKRGKEHIVKKNESLWSIARQELGDNARRADVQNYVYQIGKLNDKKSIKELNSLMINEKIYLPDIADFKTAQRTMPAIQTNASKTVTKPVKSNEKAQPVTKSNTPKTNAELGFEDLKNSVVNVDISSLALECGYEGISLSVYSIYENNKLQPYLKKQICSFGMDKNHKLIYINFNGRTNEHDIRYDYEIDRNGKITTKDAIGRQKQTNSMADKKDFLQVETVLQALVENLENSRKQKI